MGKEVSFDRWCHDLVGICGHFKGTARKNQMAVNDCVVSHDFDGLVVAEASGDVEAIIRNLNGIQCDDADHIYCLIQASGQLQVEHNCERSLLGPGDCLLLDPTKDSSMSFVSAGRLLLLHMPRHEFLRSCDGNIRIGHLLTADHPLAPVIRQQFQHFSPDWDSSASVGRANSELILGMIKLAFSNRADFARDSNVESENSQFALALELIQKNLTNSELTLGWLSRQIGMSNRQLQRMFGFENTSFSSEVRDRRLNAAAARLRSGKNSQRIHISEVAYESGFRDLSNFNRGFKSRFGMAPSEYIQTVA